MPCVKKVKKKSLSLLKDNKGSFSFYVIFLVLAILLLIIFAVTIPMVINFQVKMYKNSENFIDRSIVEAGQIKDANVRAALLSSLQAGKDSIPNQVDILSVFFQWSWLIVIVIVTVVWFLLARRSAESEVF